MAEYASFFNSFEGDRTYTAAEFVEYFASFIGNGVFWGGNSLKVNARGGTDIQVETGKAWINGYYYKNTDMPKVMSLEPPHVTMARIDRVVLRLDLSQKGRLIHAVVKTGEPSSAPVAPELQRDNAAWELGLSDIRVGAGVSQIFQSNITDLRLNADMCGVVAALIEQPDLTAIFNQYQSKYGQVVGDWDEFTRQWNVWRAEKSGDYDSIRALFYGWFNQVKAEFYAQADTDFDEWSRKAGYTKVTAFLPGGGISEVLKNTFNETVLAERVTGFRPDGGITETVEWSEPKLTVTKETAFGADGGVTEVITGFEVFAPPVVGMSAAKVDYSNAEHPELVSVGHVLDALLTALNDIGWKE